MKSLQVPFDKNGNMLREAHPIREEILKDSYNFKDELEFEDAYSTRSSAVFVLRSVSDDKKYFMFLSDLFKMILNNQINGRRISGTWTFCKRGPCYGIKKI